MSRTMKYFPPSLPSSERLMLMRLGNIAGRTNIGRGDKHQQNI